MALATTLYLQHGKAKAKAAEVAGQLAQTVGRNLVIGTNAEFRANVRTRAQKLTN